MIDLHSAEQRASMGFVCSMTGCSCVVSSTLHFQLGLMCLHGCLHINCVIELLFIAINDLSIANILYIALVLSLVQVLMLLFYYGGSTT